MPIYLPPLSRRSFLKTSLTAAAGALCVPSLMAASGKFDPNSWALLSDIHIAADPKKVARHTNMTDNLSSVRKEILALPTKPGAVLINGDLAFNSGETGDYSAVTKLMEPIRKTGVPVMLGMGNHDNRERFWGSIQKAKFTQVDVLDRQVMKLESPNADWYVLDSLIATLHTPGVIGEQQREWLKKSLDANPNKPAIVMVHHNPIENGLKSNLDDQKEMFDVLRPRKQVKAWVFGHTHQWGVSKDVSGIHLINLPPVGYVFTPGQPNGWVHATVRKDGLKLELSCLDKTHQENGRMTELKWRA
jgi:Icc protein